MGIAIHKLQIATTAIAIATGTVFLGPSLACADGRQTSAQPVSYVLSDYGVQPMHDVIAHVTQATGGKVLKIKLDTKKNPQSWKYKTEVLLPNGRVVKIEHDAQTLLVLKYKVKS